MTPTQRTLAYLRGEGWQCAIVEKYLKFGHMAFGRRIDVYGFGDVLACHPGGRDTPPQIALVQACAGTDHDRRARKIRGNTRDSDLESMSDKERIELAKVALRAKFWKKCGGIILLISWSKRGARGERKLWTARIEEL